MTHPFGTHSPSEAMRNAVGPADSSLSYTEFVYLNRVARCSNATLPCGKHHWHDPIFRALANRGFVRWSAPSHRARYVILNDSGARALAEAKARNKAVRAERALARQARP